MALKNDTFRLMGEINLNFSTLDFLISSLYYELATEKYKTNHRPLKKKHSLVRKLKKIARIHASDVTDVEVLIRTIGIVDELNEIAEKREIFQKGIRLTDSEPESNAIRLFLINDFKHWKMEQSKPFIFSNAELTALNDRLRELIGTISEELNLFNHKNLEAKKANAIVEENTKPKKQRKLKAAKKGK